VAEKRARVVAYEFRFRKLGMNPPIEVARGKVIAVCVTRDAQGKMSATPIPKEIADKIEVAPKELLA
jgi:acyl-CoA thioesterase FadM